MTDVALALDGLVPAAIYGGSLTDNTEAAYDALVWSDERAKPAWSDILNWQPPVAVTLSPLEKLAAFFDANPDVRALVEGLSP